MGILDSYQRVSIRCRCPICGKSSWCLISRDNPADPSTVICARVESERKFGEAGWLHVRREGFRPRRRTFAMQAKPVRDDLGDLAEQCVAAVDPDLLHTFAQELGLPASALRSLGIGLATGADLDLVGVRWASHAWTFPMRNHEGRVTGLRLRIPGGRKLSVRGSRQGLFLPTGLSGKCDRLFVAEGETDTAALVALGLDVIGRPGCGSGQKLVTRYVRALQPAEVVVVADSDNVGRRGAVDLAVRVRLVCGSVRVVVPPRRFKDAREWVCGGATADDVQVAVANVEEVGLRAVITEGRS